MTGEHASGPGTILHSIREDLSNILGILEGRFLYLVKEAGQGAIPADAIVNELSLLSRDLQAGFRRLVEVEERRDLSFATTRELQEIAQRCLWLFRRIRVQQIFLRKLGLEAHLRSLVSSEAFTVYQTLLNLDEEEREAQESDDRKIRMLILHETDRSAQAHGRDG